MYFLFVPPCLVLLAHTINFEAKYLSCSWFSLNLMKIYSFRLFTNQEIAKFPLFPTFSQLQTATTNYWLYGVDFVLGGPGVLALQRSGLFFTSAPRSRRFLIAAPALQPPPPLRAPDVFLHPAPRSNILFRSALQSFGTKTKYTSVRKRSHLHFFVFDAFKTLIYVSEICACVYIFTFGNVYMYIWVDRSVI